ncbi:hypothetical protein S40293_11049 [Stachybotrys chartarum IBT 40293]|nr:hypothetical protein S40293_11049 [Stachybotrys chartarum IBT 40293]
MPDKSVGFDEPSDETSQETVFVTLEIHSQAVGTSSLAPETAPFYHLIRQTASALFTFLEGQEVGEFVPQLKLVRIGVSYTPGRGGFSLGIARGLFDGLLGRLKANPWVIWLIGSQYDGFHHIKAQGKYADTFFFGSYHQAVIWTFETLTISKRVLLVDRAVPSEIANMYALLRSLTPHLSTPYVPLLASAINTMWTGYATLKMDQFRKIQV